MRNMADIQEEIVEIEKELGMREEVIRELYQRKENLEEELKEGCPHPIEFRKRHFFPRDEPLASDTEFYTCNICGKRFESRDAGFDPDCRQ